MSMSKMIGSISRIMLPATNGSRVVIKLMPVVCKHQLAQTRDLHNHPTSATPQVSSVTSPLQEQYVPQSLTEGVFKLADLKVFQDEQIIQLSFKSGQSVNYTMAWLRNLCSCPDCISNKFMAKPGPGHNTKAQVIEGPLSVARFSSSEDELVVEWLDSEYKSHTSKYNLKYLNLYASSRT